MPDRLPSLRQIDHHTEEKIRLYHNIQPDDYPPHWHMTYEIIMPEENTYNVLVEGTDYELYPGDVLIIPPGVVHEIFAPETGSRYLFLADSEQITETEGFSAVEHCFYPCMHIIFDKSDISHRRISECMFGAISEYESGNVLSAAAVKQYISILMIEAARLRLSTFDAKPGSAYKKTQQQILFSDICAYISTHCSEPLSPDDLAEKSGYSRFHFGRLFASFAGMTFHDYLTLQRLNMAKRLLYNSDASITEVAMQSGFQSIATFNRVFTAHEKMSPSEYRTLGQRLYK